MQHNVMTDVAVLAQVLEVMYVLQLDEAIMSDRKEKERGVGGGRIRKKKGKKADEVDAAFKEADAGVIRRQQQSSLLLACFVTGVHHPNCTTTPRKSDQGSAYFKNHVHET